MNGRQAPSGVAFSLVPFSWPRKRKGLGRRRRTKALRSDAEVKVRRCDDQLRCCEAPPAFAGMTSGESVASLRRNDESGSERKKSAIQVWLSGSYPKPFDRREKLKPCRTSNPLVRQPIHQSLVTLSHSDHGDDDDLVVVLIDQPVASGAPFDLVAVRQTHAGVPMVRAGSAGPSPRPSPDERACKEKARQRAGFSRQDATCLTPATPDSSAARTPPDRATAPRRKSPPAPAAVSRDRVPCLRRPRSPHA